MQQKSFSFTLMDPIKVARVRLLWRQREELQPKCGSWQRKKVRRWVCRRVCVCVCVCVCLREREREGRRYRERDREIKRVCERMWVYAIERDTKCLSLFYTRCFIKMCASFKKKTSFRQNIILDFLFHLSFH